MRKKLFLFLTALITSVMVFGQTTSVWNPAGNPTQPSDGKWETGANWSVAPQSNLGYKIVFNVPGSATCTLSSTFGTTSNFVQGDGFEGGNFIIASGGKYTGANWASVGYSAPATMTVEAGGIFELTANHLRLGMRANGQGTINVNGTVSIAAGSMYLGDPTRANSSGKAYINTGGVISISTMKIITDVNPFIAPGSFLDIKGGTLIIAGDRVATLQPFIDANRLIGYGGGGSLNIVYDAATLKTTVTANPDVTAPTVVSTNPANGETGVPQIPIIGITFSELMNQASVQAAISTSPVIANMTYSWNGKTVTIGGDAMADLTEYTVTIGTTAADNNGLTLAEAYSYKFTTIDPAAPPVIATTYPTNGAVNIATVAGVVINFTKAMNKADVESKITSNMVNSSFAWSNDDKKVTITHQNFNWLTKYTVTVPAGVIARDDATALAADYTFSFTSMDQPLTSVSWNGTTDALWETTSNWSIDTIINGNYAVTINKPNSIVEVSTAKNINSFVIIGSGTSNDKLIIKNGGSITTRSEKTSNYGGQSTLIVEAGGVLNNKSHMWIGKAAGDRTKVYINGGTINVIGGMFGLNFDNLADNKDTLFLNSGSLNLAQLHADGNSIAVGSAIAINDGVMRIKGNYTDIITSYIAANKIIKNTSVGGLRSQYYAVKDSTFVWVDKLAPEIAEVYPADGSTQIHAKSKIVIKFSDNMNSASVNAAITVVPALTNPVFTWNSASDTLSISADTLSNLTKYTVTIGVDANDLGGNALAAAFSFSFTTADEPVAPTILSVKPADKSVNIEINSSLVIEFSEPMNASSVAGAIAITPSIANMAFAWNANSVTVTGDDMKENTNYTVTIGTSAKDLYGLGLVADYTFSFTTATDRTPPTVVNIIPANNAVEIAVNKNIIVEFSELMDTTSVKNAITITPAVTNMKYEWSGNSVVISSADKTFSNIYTIAIATTAKDTAGNFIQAAFSSTFTTASENSPPTVANVKPLDKAVQIDLNSSITITFSKNMDAESVKAALSISPIIGNLTYAWTGSTLVVKGDAMAGTTTYIVSIANTAADTDGNKMVDAYSFSFTTVNETTPPTVLSTVPANGSVDVALNSDIVIQFSESMDTKSVEGALRLTTAFSNPTYSWNQVSTTFIQVSSTLTISADDLMYGTAYEITIGNTATDLVGNALVSDYKFAFNTIHKVYTVTFVVNEQSGPVVGAEVVFQSITLITNTNGTAKFTGIKAVNNAPYTVSKTGYDIAEGTLSVVDADVKKTLTLTKTVGVQEASSLIGKVYPNPASEELTIELNENIESLQIYNVLGECVFMKSDLNNSNIEKIDVSSFNKGVYIIQAQSKGQINLTKIIVK